MNRKTLAIVGGGDNNLETVRVHRHKELVAVALQDVRRRSVTARLAAPAGKNSKMTTGRVESDDFVCAPQSYLFGSLHIHFDDIHSSHGGLLEHIVKRFCANILA